jgi:hypothetical protein
MGKVVFLHPPLKRARDAGVYAKKLKQEADRFLNALDLQRGGKLRRQFERRRKSSHGLQGAISMLSTTLGVSWERERNLHATLALLGVVRYTDDLDTSDTYEVMVHLFLGYFSRRERVGPKTIGYHREIAIARIMVRDLGFDRRWEPRPKKPAPLWPPRSASENARPTLRLMG